MLDQIDVLLPIAAVPEHEFCRLDTREEAAAIAASLGRNASYLPDAFRRAHPEIDWPALEEFRVTAFHDKICVLLFRRDLLEHLPDLKKGLQKALAEDVNKK